MKFSHIFVVIILAGIGFLGYRIMTDAPAPQKNPRPAATTEQAAAPASPKKAAASQPAQTPRTDAPQKQEPAPAAQPKIEETPADNQPSPKDAAEPLPKEDAKEEVLDLSEFAPSHKKSASTVTEGVSKSFLSRWKKKYAVHQELKTLNENYPLPWGSWFGGTPEIASSWFMYMGPLGVRAFMHDTTWSDMEGFKGRYPALLKDANGELLVNSLEVRQVIPGSPADGFLKEGDLIVAMDGAPLKGAASLKHRLGPYQFQKDRSLEMHVGELLDRAEGKGKISFTVLRPSEIKTAPAAPEIKWAQAVSSAQCKGEELNVPLKPGQLCRLKVTDGGNGNGGDGTEWKNLRLVKNGKSLPLHKLTPMKYTVGYGGCKIDPDKGDWFAHAPSEILFEVPEGGDWVLKGSAAPLPNATVDIIVETRAPFSLPPTLSSAVKEISFPIQPIGSYQDGFPKDCLKKRNVIKMTADWLAAQQKEDGSWDRPGGYTGNIYDTAVAGLALMATGDPAYNKTIEKAAHYITFCGFQDKWTTPLSHSVIFLCEYYLRFQDKTVLPYIRNNTLRLCNEMMYGEFCSGHGAHPGYAGTGVSVGGSHMTLALALACKTPIDFDKNLVDKCLNRAQQIAPDGVVPYGRTIGHLSLEPNLQSGSTYSGRHGPYLCASYIHGGPRHFTKVCSALYEQGELGGADQGHSTETLTILWNFPAAASVSEKALERQLESFIWKLTLLRTFDGSFCFNANRTEYQGAEGVLGVYIRTGAWLTALCADKHNLAITGKPEFRAKSFTEVAPVADPEARIVGTYKRNYAFAIWALGKQAPARLKETLKAMNRIPLKAGCRQELMKLLRDNAPAVAQSILDLKGKEPRLLAYCAEIALGMDVRIDFEPKADNKQEFDLKVMMDAPLSGRSLGFSGKERDEAKKAGLPFTTKISFADSGKIFSPVAPLSLDEKRNTNDMDCTEQAIPLSLAGGSAPEKPTLSVKVEHQVGNLKFEYIRPITANKEEAGCGEKMRKITNDRILRIPGILMRDHGNWGLCFYLPDGTYVSNASQGNQVTVTEKGKTWLSPRTRTLMAGSKCFFNVSTGWLAIESRTGEVELLAQGTPEIKYTRASVNHDSLPIDALTDDNLETGSDIPLQNSAEVIVTLPRKTVVSGVDIRAKRQARCKITISCNNNGKWIPIHWSQLKDFGPTSDSQQTICDFHEISTDKLKITFENQGNMTVPLAELRVYGEKSAFKTGEK